MSEKTYTVGYGKPPRSGQFKPGASGNPKGRPRGSRNLASDLEDELLQRISVKEGGEKRKISKQRALVKALCAKALNGDVRAINSLVRLILATQADKPSEEAEKPLSQTDQQILETFMNRHATHTVSTEQENGQEEK